jgi:hypothetical protein
LKGVSPETFCVLRLRSRTIGFRKLRRLLKKELGLLKPLLIDPLLARAFLRRRYRNTQRATRMSVPMNAIKVPTMMPVSFRMSLGLGEVDEESVWLLLVDATVPSILKKGNEPRIRILLLTPSPEEINEQVETVTLNSGHFERVRSLG